MIKSSKRKGPADVPPVFMGDTRFEAIHWGTARGLAHNGGYLRAVNQLTDEELWVLEIYDVVKDPERESDVQDVFITSLKKTLFGRKLRIADEAGRRYLVDPGLQTVLAR
jgi:hypothetical protein